MSLYLIIFSLTLVYMTLYLLLQSVKENLSIKLVSYILIIFNRDQSIISAYRRKANIRIDLIGTIERSTTDLVK